ncbi:hypothetical protein [Tropicimonas sp. S265A]|uniref:VpaChn25_0724 family phage protein n=1 Tax=Tropicimonas sp. S265A TaxID=3415134 RepID=UPI003C7A8D09
MTSYLDHMRQHARIAILRFLEGAPSYTSNASMLAGLLPQVGISYTRDQIVGELTWLEEQGLVSTKTHSDDFVIATATQRGVEVATGVATYPGVQRPRPGS